MAEAKRRRKLLVAEFLQVLRKLKHLRFSFCFFLEVIDFR